MFFQYFRQLQRLKLHYGLSPSCGPLAHTAYGRYDNDLKMHVHDGKVIYNGVRWATRTPNEIGFLDVPHTIAKPASTYRIGIFGDSYVEAAQVQLEDTFYRLLPTSIKGKKIETLAFGISGWGTLHSMRAHEILGPKYDLDLAIYVFVNNDAGDNYWPLQHARQGLVTDKPSAKLNATSDSYEIVESVRTDDISFFRRARLFLEKHLYLVRVARGTLKLRRVLAADKHKQPSAASNLPYKMPNQNDLPSTWPPKMLDSARKLTELLIRDFNNQTQNSSHPVCYSSTPLRTMRKLKERSPSKTCG